MISEPRGSQEDIVPKPGHNRRDISECHAAVSDRHVEAVDEDEEIFIDETEWNGTEIILEEEPDLPSRRPLSSGSSSFFEKTSENINAALLDFLEAVFPKSGKRTPHPGVEKSDGKTPELPGGVDKIPPFQESSAIEPSLAEFSLEDSSASFKGHPWFHPPKNEDIAAGSMESLSPFSPSPEQSFFRQAGLYAGKEGLPAEEVSFSTYFPDYSSMNPIQSDWYFYWRSNVRKKIFIQTEISYVFLYVYELIHLIGFSSPGDALDQILFVWKEARCKSLAFDPYLAVWVRDFILYYGLDLEYYSVVEGILGERTGKYLYQECILYFLDGEKKPGFLHALEECSDYPVTEGRFYKNGYDSILEDAICCVFSLWNTKYMEKEKKNLLAAFCGKGSAPSAFKPFESALFYEHGQMSRMNDTRINSKITYVFLPRTIESTLIPGLNAMKKWRKFTTGLLRTVESLLRDFTGYRWSINKGRLSKSQTALIEKQCIAFYQEYQAEQKRKEKKLFYVDNDVLSKLKTDSEQVRQHLISRQEQENAPDDFFEEKAGEWPSDVRPDAIPDEKSRDFQLSVSPVCPDPVCFPDVPESAFLLLVQRLSSEQSRVMALLCEFSSSTAHSCGNFLQELRRIASVSNTFPDVIIEEINNLAMDLVGDCVIDSNGAVPSVYPDYLDEIKEAMSNGGS